MAEQPTITRRLDRIAVGVSGLCVIHCVATTLLLGLLASVGGILGKPIIHEVGLTIAMVLGALALGRGAREHGFLLPAIVGLAGLALMAYALTLRETPLEPVWTIMGVMILALGHRLNWMAAEHGL